MRRSARPSFFFTLVLLLALSAMFPMDVKAAAPKSCPNGLTGNPPGKAEFPLDAAGKVAMKEYARKVTCANACFDERVTLKISVSMKIDGSSLIPQPDYKLVLDTSADNLCKGTTNPTRDDAKKAGRGCEFKNQPQITLMMLDTKTNKGPISRCYDSLNSLIDDALGSVEKAVKTWNTDELKEKLAALDDLGPQAPIAPTPLDTREQTLDAAFEKADELAKEDPAKAAELRAAATTGDVKKVEAVADKLGIDLNKGLSEKGKLTATTPGERDTGAADSGAGSGDPRATADTTFGQPPQTCDDPMCRAACAISRIESSSCYRGRPDNYHLPGPEICRSYGCGRAHGKYQVMWFNIPSWTAQSCGRTMYDPDEFRADPDCQEQVFQTMFAKHVAACNGSYEGAAAMWHSGYCNPPSRSTDGFLRTSAYVQRFSHYFNGATLAPAAPYSRSPFANVNPILSASPVGYAPTGYTPAGVFTSAGYTGNGYYYNGQYYSGNYYGGNYYGGNYGRSTSMNPMAFLQPVFSLIQQSESQQSQQQSQSVPQSPYQPNSPSTIPPSGQMPPPPPEPVALIIVQPREVPRGKTLLVSWSTVGMSASEPCGVYVETGSAEELLARGNEGSRTVRTSATSTAGVWNFSLRCTSTSGDTVQDEASVLVQ